MSSSDDIIEMNPYFHFALLLLNYFCTQQDKHLFKSSIVIFLYNLFQLKKYRHMFIVANLEN